MNTLEFYIERSKTQKYKINNIIKRSDGAGLTDMNISPELYSKLYAIQQHCFPRELINNFDENSYSELIKLKSQLNRD